MVFFEEFPNIKIEKNDAKSLRESTGRLLEEGIYSGYLPPGSRLIESELANNLKISRTPIREALLQLESKGLVKIMPNKGAIVTPFSIDEIEEIYIIFGALAGVAASLSVELITDDELKQMEALVAKMKTCKGGRESFDLNNEFHSTFIKPCRKNLLLKLVRNYTKQVGRYWYLFLSHPKYMELFSKEHETILEAFKSRNSKLARESVEDHVRSFGEIVIEGLKSFGPVNFLEE